MSEKYKFDTNFRNSIENDTEFNHDLYQEVDSEQINRKFNENYDEFTNIDGVRNKPLNYKEILDLSKISSYSNCNSNTLDSSGSNYQRNTMGISKSQSDNDDNECKNGIIDTIEDNLKHSSIIKKSNDLFSVSKMAKSELKNNEYQSICRKIFRAFLSFSIDIINIHLRILKFKCYFKTCSEKLKEAYSFAKVKKYSSQKMREIFKKTDNPGDNDLVIAEIDLNESSNEHDERFRILKYLIEITLREAFIKFLNNEKEFTRYVKLKKKLDQKEETIYLNYIKLAKNEFRITLKDPNSFIFFN